jgi:hypothetical protein
MSDAKEKLQAQRKLLLAECNANSRLQRRFDHINRQMKLTPSSSDDQDLNSDSSFEMDENTTA